MRTIKALLCVAALAAGIATSLAQSNVYSLNVVGYYNIPVAAGQSVLIANQLNTTNNTIAALFPNGPAGSYFYKYNGGWSVANFDPDLLDWEPSPDAGNTTLNMGEGGMFKAGATTTLTFVGEVQQGQLTVPLVSGGANFVRSSIVPQAGLITTDLKYPGEPGDYAYKFNNGWSTANFDPDLLDWEPSEPSYGVGEAMMLKKNGPATAWVRNFTVQ
jgi:hypothetical protein